MGLYSSQFGVVRYNTMLTTTKSKQIYSMILREERHHGVTRGLEQKTLAEGMTFRAIIGGRQKQRG